MVTSLHSPELNTSGYWYDSDLQRCLLCDRYRGKADVPQAMLDNPDLSVHGLAISCHFRRQQYAHHVAIVAMHDVSSCDKRADRVIRIENFERAGRTLALAKLSGTPYIR